MKKHALEIILIIASMVCALIGCHNRSDRMKAIPFEKLMSYPDSYDNKKLTVRCKIAADGVDGVLMIGEDFSQGGKDFLFTEFDKSFSDKMPDMGIEGISSEMLIVRGIFKSGGHSIKGNRLDSVPYFIINQILDNDD